MADGGLSQDEIDALLADTDFEDFESPSAAAEEKKEVVTDIAVPPSAMEQPKPAASPKTSKSHAFDDINNLIQSPNMELLMDVKMELTVELGRTRLPIKNILQFDGGSVVELEKMAGEPVDLLVNNRLIAHGEVVVIDEYFGIRVTDVVDPLNLVSTLSK